MTRWTNSRSRKRRAIPEDDESTAEKELQKLHDQYIAKIDEHLAHKEKEIHDGLALARREWVLACPPVQREALTCSVTGSSKRMTVSPGLA